MLVALVLPQRHVVDLCLRARGERTKISTPSVVPSAVAALVTVRAAASCRPRGRDDLGANDCARLELANAQLHRAPCRRAHPGRGGVGGAGGRRRDGVGRVVEQRVARDACGRARPSTSRRGRRCTCGRASCGCSPSSSREARLEARVRRRARSAEAVAAEAVAEAVASAPATAYDVLDTFKRGDVDRLERRAGNRLQQRSGRSCSSPDRATPLMKNGEPLSARTIPCFLSARRITWFCAEKPLMS